MNDYSFIYQSRYLPVKKKTKSFFTALNIIYMLLIQVIVDHQGMRAVYELCNLSVCWP